MRLSVKQRDTIPAPYIVEPTGHWDGNDGNWTTFAISVGTPPTSFRVVPATLNAGVTIPVVGACQGTLASLTNCGDLRGADNDLGFNTDNSSTWQARAPYKLFPQQNIYNSTGLYGSDTISVGRSGSTSNATIPQKTVIGISQSDFWLGSLGLASNSSALSGFVPVSLMTTMKNQSIIPSLSYGYTAGQHYNNAFGSLVLGGYDQAKVGANNLSAPINTTNLLPSIDVDVQTIVVSGGLNSGVQSVLSSATHATIDSSVSQIWLPGSVCDAFASNFGLSYNDATGYYLINDTMHDTLKQSDLSVAFTIGRQGTSSSVTITFKYNALDLYIGSPYISTPLPYFPIRRSPDDSQITLGRVFLVESYLAVDWERNNFTIGQVQNPTGSANIVAIAPSTAASASASAASGSSSATSSPDSGSSGLSGGAIAGIIIPIVLVIAAIGAFVFFWRRRRQRQIDARKSVETQPPAYDEGAEFYGPEAKAAGQSGEGKAAQNTLAELHDSSPPPAELTSDHVRRLEEIAQERELMGTPVMELEGDTAGSELETSSVRPESSIRPDRSSVASPERQSLISPTRQSLASPPERVRSPLSESSVFELE